MLVLLGVLVAMLGVLLFAGVLTLQSMLIGGALIAFVWWITSVVATTRERHRTRAH